MSIHINHLGIHRWNPFWHLTCNRNGRCRQAAGTGSFGLGVASAPASSAKPLTLFRFRDAIKFRARFGRARRAQVDFKPAANLEEVIMNNRLLIALPLAGVLAMPALAQTTSSTQAQPAATSTTPADNP